MTLIKSISGIRGTIGGKPGDNLTPLDVVKFTAAYAVWMKTKSEHNKIVIGRDARLSGDMVSKLVSATLIAMGMEVVDLGLSTTPTVEVAVVGEKASGGIIITASHNPGQWNALKLLNAKGEFISDEDGKKILSIADEEQYDFLAIDKIGSYKSDNSWVDKHIELILKLPLVNKEKIAVANFKIVVDAVNSSGGIFVPKLLKALGVKNIVELYCEPTGVFPHNPEPLPENLTAISAEVKKHKADLGIVVDPDVDRLAFVCEDGNMFGEEYTLVAVADYILKKKKGNTVSNLSSTKALRDVTEAAGGVYSGAAVGEVNVVTKMKQVNAVIGGEGNGGIIYPELHYGRDALVGIALFLTHLAETKMKVSELRASYPSYFIAKNKIELKKGIDVDAILKTLHEKFIAQPCNIEDGLKIEFGNEWVHMRKSNTEPIIRIYAESKNEQSANDLAKKMIREIEAVSAATMTI
ncbi:phosphoglucosamine mutase [Bacteroidota bacterium]|nr:phosphoglucosamine mutase [Bacteroidota bacterium]